MLQKKGLESNLSRELQIVCVAWILFYDEQEGDRERKSEVRGETFDGAWFVEEGKEDLMVPRMWSMTKGSSGRRILFTWASRR